MFVGEAVVVYALSFWQYLVYALAFLFRAVSLPDFKRDSLTTRSVSLIAFAWAYFASPLDWISLVVVGLGFSLNASAVKALGADRTYYGVELGGLPPRRVDAFPYSWIPHPMLVGNMIGYGGTLLNSDFRREWQPLAVLHIGLNLAIILMEAYVRPRIGGKRSQDAPSFKRILVGIALSAGVGAVAGFFVAVAAGKLDFRAAAFIGACSAAYAWVLWECYTLPHEATDPSSTS